LVKKLHVFTSIYGDRFLLGVQVAALLNRETYNVYRSMKVKKIENIRATSDQVVFLAQHGAVHYGTHSVTLVPFEEGLYFLAEALQKTNRNWFSARLGEQPPVRPRISRRKPPPWEVRRAISKKPEARRIQDKNLQFVPLFSNEELEELEAVHKSLPIIKEKPLNKDEL